MNFAQFLSIFRARWKIAAIVLCLTVIVTCVVSLILPKQYSAVASVVVDIRPDPVSAMAFPSLVTPGIIATQIDIIQSDRVAQRVVRQLKVAESPQVRAQWLEDTQGEGSIEQWVAQSFQKRLEVKPSRESNVISVSYKAPDAKFAAAVTNSFVQAYLDTVLELRVDPARQYSQFFDSRSKASRDALEKAQARLTTFQHDKGIIATDERFDVESSRLNELSSQLVLIQGIAGDSISRQAQAQGSGASDMQEVLNSPLVSGLTSDLARAEARLKELTAKFGDNHPQVMESRASIQELRTRIASETKRVTGGVTINNSINRQREAQIRSGLEAQREKVLQLKAMRDEGQVLMRDVDNAQRTYDAILARYTQASLESQTTQSNINVLSPALPPLEASSPKVLLNTLLAIFLGALIALGTVMSLELTDRRVRASQDILVSLGLPLLGIIPKPSARRFIGKSKLSAIEQRVLGKLPSPTKGM